MSDTIIKRLQILEDIEKELNELKNTLKGMLEDNDTYQKTVEEENEVKKTLKEKREAVLESPQIKAVKQEIKDKSQEIKEHKDVLSQELIDYYRENGTLEITDPDGNVKRMKFSVKLVD